MVDGGWRFVEAELTAVHESRNASATSALQSP